MRDELRAIRAGVGERWRAGNRPWATIGAVVAAFVFWALRHAGVWSGPIDALSAVRADQPLVASLLRVPLSIVVPAPDLPVWGALAQIAAVGTLAEVVLGRRRFVAFALATQYVATLGGRVAAWLGPGHVYGLRPSVAFVRDTGPSAVVIAAGLAVALVLGARRIAAVATAALLAEIVGLHTLAGREHLVAIALGVAMGWRWRDERRARRAGAPRVAAATCAALAGVLAAGVVEPASRGRLTRMVTAFSPAMPAHPGRVAFLLAASWFLLLAGGLRRGQRSAWLFAVATAVAAVVAPVHARGAHAASTLGVLLLVVLLAGRSSFPAPADRAARLRVVAVGGSLLTLLGAAELLPERLDRDVAPLISIALVAAVGATAWLLTRPTRSAPVADLDFHRARQIVERHGTGALDYFALRDDKSWFFHGSSVVAYAIRGSVALVSPDPIGPADERTDVWRAFSVFAASHGWTVSVLGATEPWLAVYRATGMRSLYVGDEAVVDCSSFHLQGGDRKGLRQAVQRIARNGYTVTFHDSGTIGAALRAQLEALLAAGRRGDAERGFSMTLGRPFDARDRGLLLAVSHAPDGRAVAFCQYVPQAGGTSWSLDLMRAERQGHPNGLIDHVIVETVRHLAAIDAAATLCLNFATMRNVVAGDSRAITQRALRRVLTQASASMQIESLYRFNAKFHPRWQPRYAVVPSVLDTASAAIAIARAESIFELPVVGRFLRPTGPLASESSRAA